VAYVGFVFGPWHFARYLFPLCVALMLCFALAADALATRAAEARGRAPRAIAAALVALLAAALMLQPPFAKLYRPRPPMWGYLGIGEWSARHFVPGTVIGASQSGALGYFADSLVVVNLDGVVNRDAYEAMRRGRLIEYVNASRIQYLVWQDDIEFIARESRDAARAGVTPLMQVPGIQTLGSPWTIYRVEP
jgi:hypothetical protein